MTHQYKRLGAVEKSLMMGTFLVPPAIGIYHLASYPAYVTISHVINVTGIGMISSPFFALLTPLMVRGVHSLYAVKQDNLLKTTRQSFQKATRGAAVFGACFGPIIGYATACCLSDQMPQSFQNILNTTIANQTSRKPLIEEVRKINKTLRSRGLKMSVPRL